MNPAEERIERILDRIDRQVSDGVWRKITDQVIAPTSTQVSAQVLLPRLGWWPGWWWEKTAAGNTAASNLEQLAADLEYLRDEIADQVREDSNAHG